MGDGSRPNFEEETYFECLCRLSVRALGRPNRLNTTVPRALLIFGRSYRRRSLPRRRRSEKTAASHRRRHWPYRRRTCSRGSRCKRSDRKRLRRAIDEGTCHVAEESCSRRCRCKRRARKRLRRMHSPAQPRRPSRRATHVSNI